MIALLPGCFLTRHAFKPDNRLTDSRSAYRFLVATLFALACVSTEKILEQQTTPDIIHIMENKNTSRPDVEAIIAEIQRHRMEAETSLASGHREALAAEDDLHAQLAQANRVCLTGQHGGWRGLFMRPYGMWRSEINTFNASVVRVLNRLVRLLEGEDLPDKGPLIDAQRRRLTLMEKMSDRLAAYDKLNLEERVRHLEERIRVLEGKGPQ